MSKKCYCLFYLSFVNLEAETLKQEEMGIIQHVILTGYFHDYNRFPLKSYEFNLLSSGRDCQLPL